MTTADPDQQSRLGSHRFVVPLCFLVALAEGFDIQSFGLAAADIRAAFAMDATDVGTLASASVVGLVFGTLAGGRLADRFGRKWTLIACVAAVGLFTIGTALAASFEAMLVMRLLTGLGLGGALPNLIAFAAEAAGAQGRIARVTLVVSGTGAGGICAGLFGATAWASEWQGIFVFGGVAPLLLIPALILGLPNGRPTSTTEVPPSYSEVLWTETRWRRTLWLWLGFVATQIVFYVIMNWLPVIVRDAGFSRAAASLTIAFFHVGGVIGGIGFGLLMEGRFRALVPLLSYGGVVATLIGFAFPAQSATGVFGLAFLLGGSIIGSQLVLFGLAAESYDMKGRGTGVSVSVAVGRMGGATGPYVGGAAMSAGLAGPSVLLGLLPVAIVGAVASLVLARWSQEKQKDALGAAREAR